MRNLLEETIRELGNIGSTPIDVAWVGKRLGTAAGSWSDFAASAKHVNYDPNAINKAHHLGMFIDDELVVVLRDGTWLERGATDGFEYWLPMFAPTLDEGHKALNLDSILATCEIPKELHS